MQDKEIAELEKIVQEKTYVAFADVLGYRSILLGSGIEKDYSRLKYLLDLWESLGQAISAANGRIPGVESVFFSDSFFLKSDDLGYLINFLVEVMVENYCYYEITDDRWMPWIRCGIAFDWMVEFKDLSVAGLLKDEKFAYRNPAGPAVANAYILSEKLGFKGMRILLPQQLYAEAWMSAKRSTTGNAFIDKANLLLGKKSWPESCDNHGELVYDIPWWWCIDDGLPPDRIIKRHEWQVGIAGKPEEARLHYDKTVELLQLASED
ncbi:MAG TPA: hypothetical protein PK668_13060 [Myxococcota bacterium]|nr:hypothetical protein [Myxococcota bacterium]HRY93601.1 hypothetical protein [Myxococcota bacterium]